MLDSAGQLRLAVCKISGNLGILTSKIAGGLPDFSTWESARLPCSTPVCTSIYGTDAHRFWRTTRLMTWGNPPDYHVFSLNLHTAVSPSPGCDTVLNRPHQVKSCTPAVLHTKTNSVYTSCVCVHTLLPGEDETEYIVASNMDSYHLCICVRT